MSKAKQSRRIEAMHTGYAIEGTTADDNAIADGTAAWSHVSGWDTYEDAAVEVARLEQ